jgi:MHS family shikimate/dehydroshikimate transporter-like MFS transporter
MSASPSFSTSDRRARARAARAAFIGTLLEYYDFTLFALVSATVFPTVFFPGSTPFLATFQSVATFSVAFVIRPLSGALLGSLGDRIGRRRLLFFSMMIMGVPTVGIGLIPSAATIGWVAPALLILMRVLQGVGASAEFSGATLVAVEFAPENRRGLFGSIAGIGSGLGSMAGTLVLLAVGSMVTDDQFVEWGWRIPFLLGGVILAYGLWIRSRLPETPDFEKAGPISRTPLRETLRRYPRALVGSGLVVLTRAGVAYFFIVSLVSYATGQVGVDATAVVAGVLVAQFAQALLTPVFGWLSDKVGRIVILAGGLLLLIAMAFPVFLLLQPDWPAGFAIALIFGCSISVAALLAPIGRLMSELFAVRHRYTGMGLATETGTAIGGAVVPPLAVYLSYVDGAGTTPLSLLIIGLALLALLGLLLLPRRYAGLAEPVDETPGGRPERDATTAVLD